jgi:hypothetical protein
VSTVAYSLTLREEHILRMFENIVLRILECMTEEVVGRWRKLCMSSLNIFVMIKSELSVVK